MFDNFEWLGFLVFMYLAYVPLIVSAATHKDPVLKYDAFHKSCTIPPAVFMVMWVILYALIGLAGFFFWETWPDSNSSLYQAGLGLWVCQLVLNIVWYQIFFRAESTDWALAILIILFAVMFTDMVIFFLVDTAAGVLMTVPVAWLVVAIALSIDIQMNN